MSRVTTPRILILGVVVVVCLVNAVLFGGRVFSWAAGSTSTALSAVSSRIAWVNALIASVSLRSDLAVRVAELEDENERLRGELAQFDEVQREAQSLREAAQITARPAGAMQQAAIFSYNTATGIRQAIINRGSDDGVAVGDVVMTSGGALVGSVQSVFPDHATVQRVQDVSFQVTARVSGGDIAGLVRSDGDGALILDLIQKDEVISEGALVITSGDDRYPAGLYIGTVRSVDNNVATLFQIVRINPIVPDAVHGFVLIVRP